MAEHGGVGVCVFILRHVTAPPQWDSDDDPIETPGWIGLSDTTRQELEPILAYLKGREVDDLTLSAVLSTPKASRPMKQLVDIERCWQVAAMTAAGVTSKDIAARLSCSRRLVMSIRADPITQLCQCILKADAAATDELRAARVDLVTARGELDRTRAEADRLGKQLDQVVDKLAIGEPVTTCYRNHLVIGDNVYRHGNRDYCRECNRENTIAYRKRKRAEQQRHSIRMSATVHAKSVASAS